jgi:uncharacterized membrane protein YdjX (TVP38/TMEM64 family)
MSLGPRASKGWLWVLVAALMTTATVLGIVFGRPASQFFSHPQQVRAWIAGSGPWAPVAVVALEAAQAVAAPIPGQAIEAAAGYLFGLWPGALYAMAGIALGSLIAFSLARRFGRPLISRLVRPSTLDHLDDLATRGGALFFFLVWLFPLLPDDLACLAAGLTPMPTARFLLLMIVGRLPGAVAATWLGASAERINPSWWALVLGTLALFGILMWRWGERIQTAILRLLQEMMARLGG